MAKHEDIDDEGSGEFWRGIHEAQREPRQQEREQRVTRALELLAENGVTYSTKDQVHLMIDDAKRGRIDYWPSTGLWKANGGKVTQRGVGPLLQYLGKELAAANPA